MTDVVSSETRSRMMSGIRGKDTRPELLIRKLLHGRGFRYRLHDKKLPGKPDIVLPRYRAVIMIHGCFWHGHDCHLFKWPSTRSEWWQKKIKGNRDHDTLINARLKDSGWRQARIWECALKGRERRDPNDLIKELANWLDSGLNDLEIRGNTK